MVEDTQLMPSEMSQALIQQMLTALGIDPDETDIGSRITRMCLHLVPGEVPRVRMEIRAADLKPTDVDWMGGLARSTVTIQGTMPGKEEPIKDGWEVEGSGMWDGGGTA